MADRVDNWMTTLRWILRRWVLRVRCDWPLVWIVLKLLFVLWHC